MGRSLKPAPAIEVADVESLDQEGRGVAHAGGKAVFIDGALPGETVSFRRIRRQRRYDEASVVEVLRASPDRVRPRCRHFGVCGGCSLQHLDHAAQLAAKGRVVAEALERIGGVTPDAWLPPLTGPIWSYRRRARVGSKFVDKKGKVLVGFRERGSPLLADLEVCEVLASPAGNLITPLAELIGALDIKRRVAQIEVAVAENTTALVLRVLEDPTPADLGRMREFETRHGLALYLQRGGLDTVLPLTQPGVPLRYELPGLPAGIEFAPTDFVQVNGELNRQMVAQAISLLEPREGDRALDLFCGLGNFSLPLAQRSRGGRCRRRWTPRWWRVPGPTRRATASRMPYFMPLTWRRREQKIAGRVAHTISFFSTRLAPGHVKSFRSRSPRARAASSTCPATRAALRGMQAYWCSSLVITWLRPGSWTCFRTPRTSNRSHCSSRSRESPRTESPLTLGPVMVDVAGIALEPEERELLAHPQVGSVILFARNYESPDQVTRLTAEIHAVRTPPLLVAVDQEGGRVQRFQSGFTRLPPLREVGRRYSLNHEEGLALARKLGWLMAAELRAVGVDMSFAPCVDVDYGVSRAIGDRALHPDAAAVAELAVAYLLGMRDAGMAATAKHFPGHGAVAADSHVALPVDRREWPDIEADLRPYRRLIANGLPAVMAAHVVFPADRRKARESFEALAGRSPARRPGLPGCDLCR